MATSPSKHPSLQPTGEDQRHGNERVTTADERPSNTSTRGERERGASPKVPVRMVLNGPHGTTKGTPHHTRESGPSGGYPFQVLKKMETTVKINAYHIDKKNDATITGSAIKEYTKSAI